MSVRILSVGTAVPEQSYSQDDVLELLGTTDPKIRRLFLNSHIERRHLLLPPVRAGAVPQETPDDLSARHLHGAVSLGVDAVKRALARIGRDLADIDFLVCVTSTGFLCPGVSAHVTRALGLRDSVRRVDIVGMGCNAAMNALQTSVALAQARPGALGVQLSVEICSAAYVVNETMATAVVNSLFGDGAAAITLSSEATGTSPGAPQLIDFESFILTDAIGAMRFDVDGDRLSFHLDRDIPYVIGRHVDRPVRRLLARHGLAVSDVDHWVLHSGGKKVIDAIVGSLGLSEHAVRHTREILRSSGNMSSAAVLFALQRTMYDDTPPSPGQTGVMIAMGPGTSIEAGLLRW